jgi:hypothetical protein
MHPADRIPLFIPGKGHLLPWGNFIGNTPLADRFTKAARRAAPKGITVRRFGGSTAFYSYDRDHETRPAEIENLVW